MNKSLALLTVLGAACGGGSSGQLPDAGVVLELDAQQRFQTFSGFGGSFTALDDPGIFNRHDPTQPALTTSTRAQREGIAQVLYGEIGITRTRLFPAAFEPQNDDDDPMTMNPSGFVWERVDPLVEWAELSRARGLSTPWMSFGSNSGTPSEAWLRVAGDACALDPHKLDELVEWHLAAASRFKERGNELPFMTINNEPDFCPIGGNPTPYFVTPEQMVELVKRLGARLAQAGIGTRLVVTDGVTPGSSIAYMRAVLEDATARSYVGAIAYHSYDGYQDLSKLRASAQGHPNGADIRAEVATLAKQYGLPLWMSEVCYCAPQRDGADGPLLSDFELCRLRMNHVFDELTLTGVSAFDVMNVDFLDRPGVRDELVHLYFAAGGALERFEIALYGRFIGHFGRAVPEGSVRVAATSSDGQVRAVAFERPDGKLALVLLSNRTDSVLADVAPSGLSRSVTRFSMFSTGQSGTPWQAGADALVAAGRARITVAPGMTTLLSD